MPPHHPENQSSHTPQCNDSPYTLVVPDKGRAYEVKGTLPHSTVQAASTLVQMSASWADRTSAASSKEGSAPQR